MAKKNPTKPLSSTEARAFEHPIPSILRMIQCANVSFDPGCINQLICEMNKQSGGHYVTLSDSGVLLYVNT